MNRESLSHSNMQKQDNFDDMMVCALEPVSLFKERNYMSHERRLYDFTQDLVARYGKHENYDEEEYTLFLDDLPIHEQSKLLQLFIESIDREIESEAILGKDYSIDNDYNCSLLFFLDRDSPDNSANLSEVIRKNLITHYADTLQSILDDACVDYISALNEYDADEGCWELEESA